jgi:glycosyltransferase involved in cell wall biosynthesis
MLEQNSKSNSYQSVTEKTITVVIPTLNEEEAIGKVLNELQSLGFRNIVVVDGYSTDRTVEIAKQFGVKTISQHGKGKTGALKTAIEHIETPYLLVMDGDYTYDASCINRFIQHLDSYDEIIGARIADDTNPMSFLHIYGNKIITKLFNNLMGTSLSDLCSGMYVVRTKALQSIDLSTTGFDVEAEIAAQIASLGRITEVPINYRSRLGKQKLSTWRHGYKIVKSIFRLGRLYNPSTFYSILSKSIMIPVSLMILLSVIGQYFTNDASLLFMNISIILVLMQVTLALVMTNTRSRNLRTHEVLQQKVV